MSPHSLTARWWHQIPRHPHAIGTFWTVDGRVLGDELGIIPIKAIAHYKSDYGSDDAAGPADWEQAYSLLAEYEDANLPTHALQEGEYIVVDSPACTILNPNNCP